MKNILTTLALVILVGCQEKQIERTFLTPEVVSDSIYTSMPGEMVICDEFLVWEDPFTTDNHLHIVDLNNGKEIGLMGKKGQGPKEFTTPMLSHIVKDRCLRVEDANTSRRALFSIDSLLQGKDYYIELPKAEGFKGAELEENMYFRNAPDSIPYYFELTVNDNTVYFGNYPIENERFHVGGNIAYDPVKGHLVYATWDFPYMALYQKEKNSFKLLHERKKKPEYHVADGKLFLENREKVGAFSVILLKDYIVTLERDYQTDNTNEMTVGRDFTKCPQTIFLYDYELNLKKIVNLRMPIVRITGSATNNMVYAMVVNPEFTLVKCDVGEL